MFTRKEHFAFIAAIAIITFAYLLMAMDPQPNGFGVLTLWAAPPILLIGFALPVVAILGIDNLRKWRVNLRTAKHLTGLAVLSLALLIYVLTLEPTASLWDCSEFIAAAYKLQVPHTPGTPLSLLVGRMFAMFASGPTSVALMLNISSAFFSALCIFLVYHLIYHFAAIAHETKSAHKSIRQLVDANKPYAPTTISSNNIAGNGPENNDTRSRITSTLAAMLGSLTLLFSDTFWFSAVEAETYGIACFFLLVLVTLIIRGKNLEGEKKHRWLVLIAYVGGLSYCIHPMCVLALALLPYSWFNVSNNALGTRQIFLLLAGLVLVFLINRLVAIGVFQFAFGVDKFFVNGIGLPFYSGAIFFLLFMIGAFALLIQKLPQWRPATWATVFLIAGFAPYVMMFIRSNHNPPIDENNPQDLPLIKAYMNRESYPTSPLLYGPYFDAEVEDVEAGRRVFHRGADRYELSGTMSEYRFDKNRSTILPRLYSNDPDHIEAYRQWLGLEPNERPRFGDNLKFLFSYQIGHMYLRYLLFNFAGRESDRQNADWLKPWNTTSAHKYSSKARNQYWMLPLLAGIAGAIFQWRNDRKGFIAVLSLFLITGLILALYLNSPPIEPRERDYIYVASFIAFCIWVGLSVVPLSNAISRRAVAIPLITACAAGIPLLMAVQNYDDHDRSERTFQVDNARNLLSSCAPNAILFTGGDNDTFPLWYIQEVEGFRTDVRVMVLSYMNTDWYINQLRNRYYESAPFKLTLDKNDYLQYGPNDVLYIQESIREGIDAAKYVQLIKDGNKALRMQSSTGDYFTILPSKKLFIKRSDTLVQSGPQLTGGTKGKDSLHHADLVLRVKGNYATKSVLGIVDLMISNQWERPIYFNYTSLNTAGLELNDHVVQEGAVYRFDPMRTADDGNAIDRDTMYKNLIEKGNYSNLMNPHVHFNYEDFNLRTISPLRQSFNALAASYLDAGNREKALAVMQFAQSHLYLPHLYPTFANLEAAEIFAALGENESAASLCSTLFDSNLNELKWQRDNDIAPDGLDRFLAQQSARMLAALGDKGPEVALSKLGI